ncbi:hypothetical protein EMIHUDRAFT_437243 [Emiliania huxleyi CCMP1516]|uniref:START domain-containing protein n=2 Tax=Emiliania huxleyi TaxID=2903 RepID=A0A0D3INT6_EMIH1|nr:hypothetical protein EMIHUDRAFT_437243 [Emiliania huxleyi CCMP1516]EOD12921.1 hypothetical protein EMIHUDRAFT_437243 [Emiliania huxleyi CCMP1516]|eukprot:XP_005765350.1 hypothetical protein EMIHUDRAFT_437243 [Emiliania huxleyi CCMP1516]
MERTIAIPQGWGNSTARREEWSKCVARYAALCSKPGDGDEDLPGKSTPTSSGALDHLASIATEELLRRRSKRKRSIIDRPLGEAPVPVVERVLNHWLTGLFRTASGETMAESLFAPDAFVSIELSIEGAATPASLPRFQIPSIKYFLMWDRAIFSKYNTSAYHIDYVLENLDGSVAVQIRHTPTLLNGEQPTGGQEVIMHQLWEVTGGGRVRSFQRFCAASPTTEAAAPPSTCAWVSPLSRRALERVRGSFGEDAPLARASWSAEEGDGGAGGGGVGGGSGGGTGGGP